MRLIKFLKAWSLRAAFILVALVSGCETTRTDSFEARYPDEPRRNVAAVSRSPSSASAFNASYPDDAQRREQSMAAIAQIAPAAVQIKSKAERGDAQAQFQLGEMYEQGQAIPKSYAEALRWWLRAANQGLTAAERKVGIAYAKGLGVKRDQAVALEWLCKAKAKGDTGAEAYIDQINWELTGGARPHSEAEAASDSNRGEFAVRSPGGYVNTQPVQSPVYAQYQEQVLPANPQVVQRLPVRTAYVPRAADHWIKSVIDHGKILSLENGSLWQISPLDTITTTLWLPVSRIAVIQGDDLQYPYKLINTDAHEVVNARFLVRTPVASTVPQTPQQGKYPIPPWIQPANPAAAYSEGLRLGIQLREAQQAP
ncbi:MAG: hypothetical protein C5B50_24955 [Verrucomicrobia bacterium]|nr:MAG: hypothetical protein C5B50_24955 [Verrucomicrobiota bacterium]